LKILGDYTGRGRRGLHVDPVKVGGLGGQGEKQKLVLRYYAVTFFATKKEAGRLHGKEGKGVRWWLGN